MKKSIVTSVDLFTWNIKIIIFLKYELYLVETKRITTTILTAHQLTHHKKIFLLSPTFSGLWSLGPS